MKRIRNIKGLAAVAEEEVCALVASLPEELQERAGEVAREYLPRPTPDLVADGVEPDSLGLFSGASLRDGPTEDFIAPVIHLFLENILDYAEGDMEAFREEVCTTWYHEFGHYLGLEEDDLEERGLE